MTLINKILIKTIAAESLGVRSFANYIETPSIKIFIDPGCALGPTKKHKIPHPYEYLKLIEKTDEIIKYAKNSDVIVISHYHNDHFKNFVSDYFYVFTNSDIAEQIYTNKIVLLKDSNRYINYSQKKRAKILLRNLKKVSDDIIFADGKKIEFGDTKLNFSVPVYHGEYNSNRGWVIMTSVEVENDVNVLFTSDVQGPIVKNTMDYIIKNNPNYIFLDSPRIDNCNNIFINNLKILISISQKIIIDHHLLRNRNWHKFLKIKLNDAISKVQCAAEFNNEKILMLESIRYLLYDQFPPNTDFLKWSKLPDNLKKTEKPHVQDDFKSVEDFLNSFDFYS